MASESAIVSTRIGRGAYPWPWLTVEVLLYACLGLGALVIRLTWLSTWPLRSAEAATALAAWRSLSGGALPAEWSPLLMGLQRGLFWLLGPSEAAARLVPALAGASLALLPSQWRRELGRIGALAAVLLLTLSPALLTFSLTADGTLLASALCAWAFTCAWRALADHRPRWLLAAAALLGLGLATAPNAYTWLLAALLIGGVFILHQPPAARRALAARLPNGLLRQALIVLATAWALGASALLTNLAGLNQAAALPWRWLRGLGDIRPPWGWYGMARNLLAYEPLLLFLGGYGALRLLRRRAPAAAWLIGWWGAAALLSWLASAGQPGWIVDALWPLAALAVCGVQGLWDDALSRLRTLDGAALAPLAALSGFIVIELSTYARVADGRLLIYAGIGLVLLLCGLAAYRYWAGLAAAGRIAALLLIGFTLTYTIRADSALLYETGADPRESYAAGATAPAIRGLPAMLAAHSSHTLRDARSVRIAYPEALDPLLGWTLHTFPRTTVTSDKRSIEADALILPVEGESAGPKGYIGQRFIVSQRLNPAPISLRDALRWFLMREPFGSLSNVNVGLWLAVPGESSQP